jgi:hypothetical protein
MSKKIYFVVGILILLFISVGVLIWQKDEPAEFVPALVSFDSSPLHAALSTCNKIQIINIYKTKEVLYETGDAEEVKWVIDSLTVKDTDSRKSILMSLPHYILVFLKDSELLVRLEMKKQSALYWDQGSWDWKSDFWLTDESYGKLMPWLCEKSGKSEHELFFPDMGIAIRGQEKGK